MTNLPKIAIIVLNWNGKQDTLTCLESLQKLTCPRFEVIVVDNGSTDDSAMAMQRAYPHHIFIVNSQNLGFAEGNNVGIRLAMERGAELLFLLNNDTIVAPDILERFVEGFAAHPQAGILGAKICRLDHRETLDHLGGRWNRKTGKFDFIGGQEPEAKWQETQELDYVCGAGLIVRRAVIEKIGLLDPRFFLIWEESDFCFRARRAGFQVLTCPQAKLWHKVSASFTGKPHSTYYWWRNRLLWIEKNCSPWEKWSLYARVLIPNILPMVRKHWLKRERNEQFYKNRAALWGVRDYLLRRFGKGPDKIGRNRDDRGNYFQNGNSSNGMPEPERNKIDAGV